MAATTKAAATAMQRVAAEVAATHARAMAPAAATAAAATPTKTKYATTTVEEWTRRVEEDAKAGGRFADEATLGMFADLVEATREKRRLTIDWRGAAMTPEELIQATAKRVGLVPPELGKGTGGR